jgi:hypothetical protein
MVVKGITYHKMQPNDYDNIFKNAVKDEDEDEDESHRTENVSPPSELTLHNIRTSKFYSYSDIYALKIEIPLIYTDGIIMRSVGTSKLYPGLYFYVFPVNGGYNLYYDNILYRKDIQGYNERREVKNNASYNKAHSDTTNNTSGVYDTHRGNVKDVSSASMPIPASNISLAPMGIHTNNDHPMTNLDKAHNTNTNDGHRSTNNAPPNTAGSRDSTTRVLDIEAQDTNGYVVRPRSANNAVSTAGLQSVQRSASTPNLNNDSRAVKSSNGKSLAPIDSSRNKYYKINYTK